MSGNEEKANNEKPVEEVEVDVEDLAGKETVKFFNQDLLSKMQDDELNDVIFAVSGSRPSDEDKDKATASEPPAEAPIKLPESKPTSENAVELKANRGLLSVMSPVFRKMFTSGLKESQSSQPIIEIIDSDPESFGAFLKFFYAHPLAITHANVGPMLQLASKYMVQGLINSCAAFLMSRVTMQNLIAVLESLHSYSQTESFDGCIPWMKTIEDSDAIVALFESAAFEQTSAPIVNALLTGFTSKIDAVLMWVNVFKWAKAKAKPTAQNDDQKQEPAAAESKDAETDADAVLAPVIDDETKGKLLAIRNTFPFYLLPMRVICASVLPLGILTQEMKLELMTHGSNEFFIRKLAESCIEHSELLFPKADIDYQDVCPVFEIDRTNRDAYAIECKKANEYSITYKGTTKILFGNVPLKPGHVYRWEVVYDKITNNSDTYLGVGAFYQTMDLYAGKNAKNSWAVQTDQNRQHVYVNGKVGAKMADKPKAGSVISFEYDGNSFKLTIQFNGKLWYCIEDVKCSDEAVAEGKQLYPTFTLATTGHAFTVRNFQYD